MQTIVLKVDPVNPEPEIIERAAQVLRRGGLVGFPTETVYGLAADAMNPDAVQRVYEVKGRPANKPLSVQVATYEDIAKLVSDVPDVARKLMEEFFPGALTIVMRASRHLSEIVTARSGKVGVRMPDHRVALALVKAFGGPIVAPSANPSDLRPPTTAEEVMRYFDGSIDLVLDAGPTSVKVASTVIDVTETPPKILRLGSITADMLAPYIKA